MNAFDSPEKIAREIFVRLGQEEINELLTMTLDELIQFHHTVGRAIRNDYHLWSPDNPHTDSSDPMGDNHPDQVSMRIIELVWEYVHTAKQKGINK